MTHARSPQEIDALYAAAVNRGDAEAVVAFYEPHGVLVLRDGTHARGHEEIRRALAPMLALRPTTTLETLSVVEGAHVAVLRTRWSLRGTAADGSPVERGGTAIEVVRRQADGTWRYAIDDPGGA